MNYYVVARGRKPGIYLTWPECNNQVHKYKGALFKKFTALSDAEAYYCKYHSGTLPKDKKYLDKDLQKIINSSIKYKHTDNCLLCGKPFKQLLGKGGTRKNQAICSLCKKKQVEFNSKNKNLYGSAFKRLSLPALVYIKKQYNCTNVFSYIKEHPYLAMQKYNVSDNFLQEELKRQRLSDNNLSSKCGIPVYIIDVFGPDKQVLKASGNMKNPKIFYHCKKCNQDFTVYYNNYKRHQGHDCVALLSSGEAVIKDFLEKHDIKFVSEEATLKCVNPDTGYQLPYDFEIPGRKILIEVQGEQHRKYIERFHVDEAGFKYQQWKDAYKKKFAEQCGYQLIEIWYEDIKNGRYESIILEAVK